MLGATSIVFGPKQLGHFEFVGDFKHYSPGPIRAVLSTALLHVFNYGAAPILLQMVCNDSFGQAIPGCATQVSVPSLQTRQISIVEAVSKTVAATASSQAVWRSILIRSSLFAGFCETICKYLSKAGLKFFSKAV